VSALLQCVDAQQHGRSQEGDQEPGGRRDALANRELADDEAAPRLKQAAERP
jgi:hypothetical protein